MDWPRTVRYLFKPVAMMVAITSSQQSNILGVSLGMML
jgi:hypothetical protein